MKEYIRRAQAFAARAAPAKFNFFHRIKTMNINKMMAGISNGFQCISIEATCFVFRGFSDPSACLNLMKKLNKKGQVIDGDSVNLHNIEH